MAKVQILFTCILEGDRDVSHLEEELNRLLSKVEDEIISVQFDELQENGEYRILVVTK